MGENDSGQPEAMHGVAGESRSVVESLGLTRMSFFVETTG
jgi:hypothetical protein